MILGVGVDITQNSRFDGWVHYDAQQLRHIFSDQELNLCKYFDTQRKKEFFASRFAAKEAFFKALSAALVKLRVHAQTTQTFDFLFACKHIDISAGVFGVPQITVDWMPFNDRLGVKIPEFNVDLTFSHEKDYSVAVVIIST